MACNFFKRGPRPHSVRSLLSIIRGQLDWLIAERREEAEWRTRIEKQLDIIAATLQSPYRLWRAEINIMPDVIIGATAPVKVKYINAAGTEIPAPEGLVFAPAVVDPAIGSVVDVDASNAVFTGVAAGDTVLTGVITFPDGTVMDASKVTPGAVTVIVDPVPASAVISVG